MSDFKVGDKIRINSSNPDIACIFNGLEGVVDKLRDSEGRIDVVLPTKGRGPYGFDLEEVVKIASISVVKIEEYRGYTTYLRIENGEHEFFTDSPYGPVRRFEYDRLLLWIDREIGRIKAGDEIVINAGADPVLHGKKAKVVENVAGIVRVEVQLDLFESSVKKVEK